MAGEMLMAYGAGAHYNVRSPSLAVHLAGPSSVKSRDNTHISNLASSNRSCSHMTCYRDRYFLEPSSLHPMAFKSRPDHAV